MRPVYAALLVLPALLLSSVALGKSPKRPVQHAQGFICGTTAGSELLHRTLLTHALNQERLSSQLRAFAPPKVTQAGDIAVIEDNGTLILGRGSFPFDLDNRTLRFVPNSLGGYDVSTKALSFDTNLGANLNAGDDTNHNVSFSGGFSFSFGGTAWNSVWVMSNGGVRFGTPGTNGVFSIEDFIAEKPAIAALFADFNPAQSGGVFVRQAPDRLLVTWFNVPEFNGSASNTVQLTLFAAGSFEIGFNGVGIRIPVNGQPMFVGYNTAMRVLAFKPVDFSQTPLKGFSATRLFESFFSRSDLDVDFVGVANAFYSAFPDSFDQLVMLSTFTYPLLGGNATAFHLLVQNDTQGTGKGIANHSAFYGSGGRLRSFINVNALQVWPSNPNTRNLPDGYNFLGIMGEETGHRWAAAVKFDQGNGPQDLLLGRSLNHWSRFTDSDNSAMEGNDWQALGNNQFQVVGFVGGYNHLDHYLMGLRAPEEVAPLFYISSPGNNQLSNRTKGVALPGFMASGTQTWVGIQDIIRAEGLRVPTRDNEEKDIRQAFILLSPSGEPPTSADLNKLSSFIAAWRPYFSQATDARATMSTNLTQRLPVAGIRGHVTNGPGGVPVRNLTVKVPDLNIVQRVPAGGYYSLRLLAPAAGATRESHAVVTEADSFSTNSETITFTYGLTLQRDVALQAIFAPNISVTPALLDFGTILTGTTASASVAIRNSGTAVLNVTNVGSDNAAFIPSRTIFSIAASASESLQVQFSPSTVASFSGTLTIQSDDPDQPAVQVALRGSAVSPPAIRISPAQLSLTVAAGDVVTDTLVVSNAGGSPLDFTVSTGGPLAVTPASDRLPAGSVDNLAVSIDAAGLSQGTLVDTVFISSNDPLTPIVRVPASIDVTPPVAVETGTPLPEFVRLHQNYPNPFNPSTTIEYELPVASTVVATIYNMRGRRVRQLVAGRQVPGRHRIVWDATNSAGDRVTSGVYVFSLRVTPSTGGSSPLVKSRKMVIFK